MKYNFEMYNDCLKAISEDAYNIHYMSEEMRTEELCLQAVTKNPYVLRFI